MVLDTNSKNQQVGTNSPVYYEELKGSVHEELEQKRKLKFETKVQVQDISLTGKKGRCEKAKVDRQHKRANAKQININKKLQKAFENKDLVSAKELVRKMKSLNTLYQVHHVTLPLLLRLFVVNACKDVGWFEFYKDVLLEGGKINLNADVCSSGTALSYACRERNSDVVKLLLGHGADVNKLSALSGQTPILIALKNNDHNLVNLLFQHGAKIDATLKLEQTIVASSCNRSSKYTKETMEVLLQYTSPRQNTLMLMYFSSNTTSTDEDIEIVKLLLEKGVDLTVKNTDGKTFKDLATEKGNTELIGLFNQKLGEPKSLEDSYVNIPYNLTLSEIHNILSKAENKNDDAKLTEVINNIQDYESQFICNFDNPEEAGLFMEFSKRVLNLQSQVRDQYVLSRVLMVLFQPQGNGSRYSVKELLLLAVAANDELTEKYQDVLFAEGNLSLLPLLVGSQKYIKIFTEKFHNLYQSLKKQTILLKDSEVGFFSVIALREEQELLDKVFVNEDALQDLKEVLRNDASHPVCGILEAASLIQNEKFTKKVLDEIERDAEQYINARTLLKKSYVTLLEAAINQEHVSIVEYLCRECIAKKGPIIQEIYKEAFTDEKIVAQINEQILKNIHSAGVGRKEKKQKIYDLILKAALHIGSMDFIIKVLDLIKNDHKVSDDADRQTFLQNSLVTILDNAIGEKRSSIIQNVYANFILKLAKNSRVEFLTIQQKYQNACHTSISVDNSVASQLNEKEPNGDDSILEQDEFEITDIQEERRPGVLGPNKTEIAGFSQEKLLEIIDFVKVGYYVSDYNLNNKKFSELEKRSYKVPAKLKEEGYKIVQFYNVNDGKQYRHAGYVFIKNKEITIVYRGSRNLFDYMKDAEMILTSSDGLLPEGGKIHSGFYSLFKDSWDSVYEILRGHANDQQLEIKDFKINLTGHSMGGAIANIAALCLSVTEGAEDLHVATFASPRVFDSSAAEIYKERLGKKTIRVVNQSDLIPSLPFGSMGYKHVGERLVITSHCSLQRAHLLDTYRNLIANIEPDQFKSDNSVSIYYYPSYLATVLYNVFTAPSYLILNIHSNDDKQYFKQVKNKHKDASLSEMMKYSGSSNEQKVVIYEDSEPGEDGFITFHTLRNAIGEKNLLTIPPICNLNIEFRITRPLIDNLFAMMLSLPRHGRGEGLKVNLPDIAFFVNNNYYLSGDTISLRLLKTLVDSYPGSLALMKKEKKSNKLNGGSSSTAAISTLAIAEVSSTSSSLGNHSNSNVQISVQSDENQQMNAEKTGSNNTPGIPEQILVPSNEKELVASTGYGMGDVITKTGNAGNLRVATLGTQQVVPRGGTVSTIEALKNLPNNRTIKIFLLNNVQSVAQIFKKSDREAELSLPNGNTYELDLHLINEESLKVLFNKENSVLANAINDFSAVKVPILEQKSDIKTNGKQSTNPNNGGVTAPSVQLVAPKSVDKNSGKKDTQPKLIPTGVPLVASKDSNRVNSNKLFYEKSSQITSNTVSGSKAVGLSTAAGNTNNSDGEDEQPPVQQTIPIVQEGFAADDVAMQGSILQTKNLDESDQLIQEDNGIALMNGLYDVVESQDTNSEGAQVNSTKGSGKYSSGSEQTLEIFNRHHSNITASTDDGSDEEFMATTANIGDESNQPIPNTASEGDFTLESNSSLQDTQPKTLATTVPVNDTQNNTDQPTSDSEKNDTTSQNTKRSKLTVIAVSTLAITGVATGIAIAVYLEMLAVGIAVGACCLVAAAIVYCYSRPSSSLENSNVQEKIARDVT